MMSNRSVTRGTKMLTRTAGIVLVTMAALAGEGPPPGPPAKTMWIPESGSSDATISADESTPPRFTVVLRREMPTPGWTFRIDSLDVDAAAHRITAKVTAVPPQGMVAQVLTPASLELPLGSVTPGSYFVELWLRRDPGRHHEPAAALLVSAR